MDLATRMLSCLALVAALLFSATVAAEEETYIDYPTWDWDLFDGDGWTPRYTYLYKDNVLGIAHYAGISYFNKRGGELAGATFRYAWGPLGEKYNIAYSNANRWWGVDFGFSWHVLNANNGRGLDGLEQLGLEMSVRYGWVSITATHTEDYSWATLGIPLDGFMSFDD